MKTGSLSPGTMAKHFLLALQFFTRIPLPARLAAWVGFSPAMMRAAAGHFPGVGWVVGGVSALVLAVAARLLAVGAAGASPFAALVAVLLALAASVWLTGAFHEDGLADVGDGLGGCVSPVRALQIMKDSRLGSYGTITLFLVLSLKTALLAMLLQAGLAQAVAALLAVHVLSRWAPLWLLRWLRYVGGSEGDEPGATGHAGSKSRALAEDIGMGALMVATWWSVPALWLLGSTFGIGALWRVLLAGAGMSWLLGRFFRRRLAGVTGDCLGATQQLVEVIGYLVLAAGLPLAG